MVGCCGMAQHPVEYLFSKLKDLKYPDGLVAVPERIRGTAFFPGVTACGGRREADPCRPCRAGR